MKAKYIFWGMIGLLLIPCRSFSQSKVTKEDYQRAVKFLPQNVGKMVFRASVNPHWAKNAPVFWYRLHTRKGEKYYLVNADKRTKKPFFNQNELAHNLSKVLDKQIDPYDLPIRRVNWNYKQHYFQFRYKDKTWKVDLKTLKVRQVQKENHSDRLSSTSPNGKWTVTRKNYNLFLKNNETGAITQLTKDGKKHLIYGAQKPWVWLKQVAPTSKKRKPLRLAISWSKDSKKFYAGKLDLRKAKLMYLLQNVRKKSFRSEVWSYYRALPGEDSVAKVKPYVFHVKDKQKTAIQIPKYDQITQSRWLWSGINLYGILRNRGYSSVALIRANTKSGKVDTLFYRTSDTYIDPLNYGYKFLPKTHELIWTSERSGWNQIYLYNLKTGKVKNRVTHGKYVVRHLVNVDPKTRTIYFTAGGRIELQDPYYLHFYRVNFDGSDLTLLTPENATHSVSLSSNHKYFVDRYSRVNKKPVTVLRSTKDGSTLMTLEKADIKNLLATGWHYPQPYKLKARDDSTEIYGMIYFPTDFNPHKKYPLVNYIYAGPQAVITPKSFMGGLRDGSGNQALAELGFIVVTVDGLGTAERSKKFHDFSYKNLGDASIPDQVKAIKYLAKKHSWIDTSRVGIWGHSAGGYDAARAMFKRPDFYKVGVSESGDHDFRVEKAWWPELYMGYPGRFPAEGVYDKQSNVNVKLVSNLKGYLLLVHGGMDTNVHPAETYRLSEALIMAGKSFDELIIPNVHHGYGKASDYATKRRWNYFIKHLMGAEPLRNFMIGPDHANDANPISNFRMIY